MCCNTHEILSWDRAGLDLQVRKCLRVGTAYMCLPAVLSGLSKAGRKNAKEHWRFRVLESGQLAKSSQKQGLLLSSPHPEDWDILLVAKISWWFVMQSNDCQQHPERMRLLVTALHLGFRIKATCFQPHFCIRSGAGKTTSSSKLGPSSSFGSYWGELLRALCLARKFRKGLCHALSFLISKPHPFSWLLQI